MAASSQMWVLETELWSSPRAAIALNPRDISPVTQNALLFFILFFKKVNSNPFACMRVYVPYTHEDQRKALDPIELELAGCWKLPYGFLELNLGPLQE